MATFLNGFEIELPSKPISVFVQDMADPEELKKLRELEKGQWFFHWREGKVYAIPEVESPERQYGTELTLSLTDHHHLGILASRINHVLPNKFPKYEALRQRPFTFLGLKNELVGAVTEGWKPLHDLVALFKVRPKFELDARLYELQDGDTRVGLFVSVSTKWDIMALLSDLQGAGISVGGLYVVRRNPTADERRLVGEVASVTGGIVALSNSFDGLTEIEEDKVWVEGSRYSFKRCLGALLRGRYEEFDKRRSDAEAELMGGPGIEGLCEKMAGVFKLNNEVELYKGASCRVLCRIQASNIYNYKTVVDVDQGEYCFDPAKRKRQKYAWPGIERFGPYSRDTFPAKSPRILVLAPDKAAGKVSQFIEVFKNGITSIQASKYASGFGKYFHLHNPEFVTVPVELLGTTPEMACKRYRETIEATLRKSPDYHAAMVAILDEHSKIDDGINPYLHAKAMLLSAGIPVQEFRMSTANQPPYNLQYILQNIAISLYAKMGGVPWTVDQGLAVDDEVVIGMGTGEISGNRFGGKQRYVGITTVFRGDGNYLLGHLSRDCAFEEYPRVLEESTVQVLKELRERNGWRDGDTVRVVFHAHKPLKKVEVARIVKACVDQVGVGLSVQFAFLTISKDHCFLVTDPEFSGLRNDRTNEVKAKMVPPRGRVVQLGRFTRLLCTKGPSLIKRPVTPLPAPVLIHLHPESTYRDLQYLSEQVLKFTNLSWRGTQPAEDPVTVYYSEMIGKLLGRLRKVDGWSPSLLNTRLRHSMWFL
jgi:hypothetical protein